jgi:hypothetical protein
LKPTAEVKVVSRGRTILGVSLGLGLGLGWVLAGNLVPIYDRPYALADPFRLTLEIVCATFLVVIGGIWINLRVIGKKLPYFAAGNGVAMLLFGWFGGAPLVKWIDVRFDSAPPIWIEGRVIGPVYRQTSGVKSDHHTYFAGVDIEAVKPKAGRIFVDHEAVPEQPPGAPEANRLKLAWHLGRLRVPWIDHVSLWYSADP